jgi:preprotein translocase subunit YajC
MSFFISDAFAEGAAATNAAAGQPDGGLLGMLPLLLIFVLFYFMLIRPQTKRAKEHKNMVEALAKGDEVVTNGGLLGKIIEVGESFITVAIADGVEVKVQKQSVSTLVPKGTIKAD